MEFRHCGDRFRVKMTAENGNVFYGAMTIPKVSNNSETGLETTRRILRVNDSTPIECGTIFKTPKGYEYLCAENGSSEYPGSDLKTYLALPINRTFEWTRKGVEIDPLTGMKRKETVESLGFVKVCFNPDGEKEDSFQIPQDKIKVVLKDEVLIGDYLGEYRVKKIDEMLGVKVCECG